MNGRGRAWPRAARVPHLVHRPPSLVPDGTPDSVLPEDVESDVAVVIKGLFPELMMLQIVEPVRQAPVEVQALPPDWPSSLRFPARPCRSGDPRQYTERACGRTDNHHHDYCISLRVDTLTLRQVWSQVIMLHHLPWAVYVALSAGHRKDIALGHMSHILARAPLGWRLSRVSNGIPFQSSRRACSECNAMFMFCMRSQMAVIG